MIETLPKDHPVNLQAWPLYSLYGLTLASDFSFANRLSRGAGLPDVTFSSVSESPLPEGWEESTPIYASPDLTKDGKSIISVYRYGACDVVRFIRMADYYIWPERILCHLLRPDYHYGIEIWLLGTALSYWLERQGVPALHASAVAVEGQAVGFLSSNKGGKSSLAASLMQLGYPLLTDDILPLERCGETFRGRPGYPQMRMWPEQTEHFLGYYHELEQVHPKLTKRRVPVGADGLGTFCNVTKPLRCFYLPERSESQREIKIVPLSVPQAVIELVRHSFMPGIVEAVGLRASRFAFFAQLAQHIPVRRITYPNGVDYLPEVREAILKDLSGLKTFSVGEDIS